MLVLGTAALASLFLTTSRTWNPEAKDQTARSVRIAAVAVLTQTLHFLEELLTGLHEQLPALFGLEPLSYDLFVLFNTGWIAIWGLSLWGLARQYRVALFPLWFLGITGTANGVLHPLIALFSFSYFPGLISSPLIGIAGFILTRRLLRLTMQTT